LKRLRNLLNEEAEMAKHTDTVKKRGALTTMKSSKVKPTAKPSSMGTSTMGSSTLGKKTVKKKK
jgi:hypothetical protein